LRKGRGRKKPGRREKRQRERGRNAFELKRDGIISG